MGRRLGSHIVPSAVIPAALYGSSVALLRIGTVKALRRNAARAFGPIQGWSVTARLAVHNCDPALEVIGKPIAAWASAIWDHRIPRSTMCSACRFACRTLTSSRPSVAIGGPAGAYMAALGRMNWTSLAPDCVRTLDGTILKLSATAPYTILQYLRDDFAIIPGAATTLSQKLTRRYYAQRRGSDVSLIRQDENCVSGRSVFGHVTDPAMRYSTLCQKPCILGMV